MSASVSVVMAVYNGQQFLLPQIMSVLGELQPDDELVVVDDASTDASPEVLSGIHDARMRVVRNARNLGLLATFERALGLARHDIVFLCDQDDLWLPGKRRAVVDAFATDPRCLVVVSDAEVIDGEGALRHASFMATRGGFRGDIVSTLVRNCYLGCAMAMRRSLLKRVLPFPDGIPLHDMWIGAVATLTGRTRYLPRPLIRYRRHGGNVSPSTHQSVSQMLRWRWSLLRALTRRLL